MEKKKQANADTEQTAIEYNLRFYEQGREVPQDALRTIASGRLKGKSDVNPMWRMKRLTEIFGPCGFGWKFVIDKQWTETYGNEVKCFCNVFLYVRDPLTKEWSEAIPGCGGSSIVQMESKGPYVNDEGYKMALTDALSIAMKALGIGANVWYGEKATGHNESKYEQPVEQNNQPQQPYTVYSGGQMKQALEELAKVQTEADFNALWNKWGQICPAITQNTTEFYKKACDKITEIRLIKQK